MIDKVYTVWSGFYSSYSVHAIFSARAQAEEYCRLHNPRALLVEEMNEVDQKEEGIWNWDYSDVYRIKEMPLDPPFEERPVGEFAFRVYMTRDGTYSTTEDTTYQEYKDQTIRFFARNDTISEWHEEHVKYAEEHQKPLCGHDVMELYVVATDAKHAIKIASERRAELLALGRWPEKKSGYIRRNGEFKEEDIISYSGD